MDVNPRDEPIDVDEDLNQNQARCAVLAVYVDAFYDRGSSFPLKTISE